MKTLNRTMKLTTFGMVFLVVLTLLSASVLAEPVDSTAVFGVF